MSGLPLSFDDLRGRRAARWLRESTHGQLDRFGPDAQREQQDRAIERYGLVDTGIVWEVAKSGSTVGSTVQFGEMLAAAGREFDILVVGYVSRFARNLRTAVNARHDLHKSGAALLFCDERVLSSDEESWETWAREAVEAEAYIRRLGKRVREGYSAKFKRLSDPGGNPPLGFMRVGPASTLAINPDTIATAVALFERYATGAVTIAALADETGMNPEGLKDLLKNPLYNGWVRRHGEPAPALWRSNPPVSDLIWSQVEAMRSRRRRGGGPKVPGRVDLFRGLIRCDCGSSVRANGVISGRHRRRHTAPACPEGAPQYVTTEWYERAVEAQIGGLALDDGTISAVVRVLAEPESPPPSIDRARLERQRRELANDFAKGRLSVEDFQARVAALKLAEPVAAPAGVSAAEAVRWLKSLPELWAGASRERKAELISAVYGEIVVRGYEFVSVVPTVAAMSRGIALALPEVVSVRQERGLISQERARRDSNPRPSDPKSGGRDRRPD
jgi:DNA invertase Pin-like site-specific DNA recombinase